MKKKSKDRKKSWDKKKFVEFMSSVMKKQALAEPAVRQIHARLSDDWNIASKRVLKLLDCEKEEEVDIIEQLVGFKEVGTRVLIDVLLAFKRQKGGLSK